MGRFLWYTAFKRFFHPLSSFRLLFRSPTAAKVSIAVVLKSKINSQRLFIQTNYGLFLIFIVIWRGDRLNILTLCVCLNICLFVCLLVDGCGHNPTAQIDTIHKYTHTHIFENAKREEEEGVIKSFPVSLCALIALSMPFLERRS